MVQPGQLQTTPMVQHSLLNQQVNFQQQQVYQQSLQNMQQHQQQQVRKFCTLHHTFLAKC